MKKKSNSLVYLAIALILVVIAASLIASTLARYASQHSATASATAAEWNFTTGAKTVTINIANSSDNANLAKDKIAPGTSGTFNIELNGAGSETGIKYTISLAETENVKIPEGLKIYTGSDASTASNEITGYIPYNEDGSQMNKEVTVNWTWELGNDGNAEAGIDNDYAGESVIALTIRGEQHIGAISE